MLVYQKFLNSPGEIAVPWKNGKLLGELRQPAGNLVHPAEARSAGFCDESFGRRAFS
jgi:hypothetical protein